ncbi:LCP family protein [Streptomyces sp. KL118A]|uniref:LCP family protein n=1 Tax=Streptomyces sp. KL118A TaxID=3045153 RepID=UPI00278C104F|nr:LCP family protein [Streptomyces sp. KL118A]
MGTVSRTPGRKRAVKRLGIVTTGLALAAALTGITAAAAPLPVQRIDVFGGMKNRPNDGPGTNILLLGTDSRAGLTESERRRFSTGKRGCDCADTMMLVHVSEKSDRVSVVGLPRDSRTVIPERRDEATGEGAPAHPAKLNAAYAEGGPQLAVHTVEEMTNVRIDHYLEIDFRRFIDAVDEAGGVRVCTKRPLKDFATKLNLKPGTHELSGGRSLQYVRSRHVDNSADFGRMQRQQRFLVGVLRTLSADRAFADPLRTARLARTVLGSTRLDQGFTVDGLTELTTTLRKLTPSATEFMTVPIGGFSDAQDGIGATLEWDRAKADKVFDALTRDRALTGGKASAAPADPPRLRRQTAFRGDKVACP